MKNNRIVWHWSYLIFFAFGLPCITGWYGCGSCDPMGSSAGKDKKTPTAVVTVGSRTATPRVTATSTTTGSVQATATFTPTVIQTSVEQTATAVAVQATETSVAKTATATMPTATSTTTPLPSATSTTIPTVVPTVVMYLRITVNTPATATDPFSLHVYTDVTLGNNIDLYNGSLSLNSSDPVNGLGEYVWTSALSNGYPVEGAAFNADIPSAPNQIMHLEVHGIQNGVDTIYWQVDTIAGQDAGGAFNF